MAAGGGDAGGDSGSSGGPAISLVKGKPCGHWGVLELVVPKGYNFKPASELGEKRSRLHTWVG